MKLSSYLVLGFLIIFFSCANDQKDKIITDTENTSLIKSTFWIELLPDSLLKVNHCKNILLLKKNDCLGCEQITANLLDDSLIMENTFIINETIRSIERKKYIKNRNYLNGKDLYFDSNLIEKVCDILSMKFNTSILIILNKKNEVVEVERVKFLVGNPNLRAQICQ